MKHDDRELVLDGLAAAIEGVALRSLPAAVEHAASVDRLTERLLGHNTVQLTRAARELRHAAALLRDDRDDRDLAA